MANALNIALHFNSLDKKKTPMIEETLMMPLLIDIFMWNWVAISQFSNIDLFGQLTPVTASPIPAKKVKIAILQLITTLCAQISHKRHNTLIDRLQSH